MKSNKIIPMFAVLVALAIGIGGFAFSQNTKKNATALTDTKEVFANYYYNYTGSPGNEDDESLWELVDESFFNNASCDEARNGCVIKTISSAPSAPAHPALVPVTGTGSAMTPDKDGINIEDAKFKNP